MDNPETAQILSSAAKHRGNWITFPFIIGTMTCLTLAGAGWFNVKSIDAAQGIVLLALTATLDSLRPKSCEVEEPSLCQTPSKLQYTVLYGAFALGSLGLGGTRFTIATMGANQFDKKEDQDSFFSWFFNRAALKAEGEKKPDGTIAKPWKLWSIQQVENLKTLVRVIPIWTTTIFVATPISMQSSLTILQALTMDRRPGYHFKIPAGSMVVIGLISTTIFLTINDRFLFRIWQKLTQKPPTLFQRVAIGHVINVLSLAMSALVESRRLKQAHAQQSHGGKDNSTTVPMLAIWLFAQLILVGIGEAFHFPGQVAVYYQEFPDSLRSAATAMISLIIGISFYLSTTLIDLIKRFTNWLPDNIDHGRLDNVYWVLVAMGMLNFCYYLSCVKFYKYQNVRKAIDETFLGSV
ncbi:hypothetical protein JCGZ_05599 [Jatropha curcas]|uniref:Uncharacterized protein n=1 Tax=Jatropha curcas TaxID=180498 RepID=A0A067L6T5_JATCU|nr:hypothetical protein JCGZ_05599 [Jatropha curcas]